VISFTQISAAAVFVLGLSCCGVAVDALTVDKCVAYSPYVVAFVAAIYANMQALARSNVETVVVFRACTPLAVSVVEYVFQGRAWPSARSCVALAGVACGALLYVATDAQRVADGWACYKWATVYFLLITFETTLGKSWTASVRMDTVWGPVLYCNVLAALPMFLLGYLNGDYPSLLPFSPQASRQGFEGPFSPRGPFRGQSGVKSEDMMEVSPAPNPPNFDGVLGTAMTIEDDRRLEFKTFWDRVCNARQTYYHNLVSLEVEHGLNNYPTEEWVRP
jgi:GDP-mannose transporter